MAAINGTFGGFFVRSTTFTVRLFLGEKRPLDQTHSLSHPQYLGGISGPVGDRRVLNLLQNFTSSAPYVDVRGLKSEIHKIRQTLDKEKNLCKLF